MSAADSLRERAEALLRDAPRAHGAAVEDLQRLVHELEVYQVELEMQNDELRRAQLELEAERARYFDLFDLAPVAYATIDADGTIKEANMALADLLGVPRSQLLDRRLSAFLDAEDAGAFHTLRRDVFGSGTNRRRTLRFRRRGPDGEVVSTAVDAAAQSEGADTALLAIVDVTDLQRHRDLVRRHVERITAILDTAIDGIIAVDEGGLIESVNLAAQRMFGYTETELVGHDVTMLMPPGLRAEHARTLGLHRADARAAAVGIRRELLGRRKDGTEFPLEIGLGESADGTRYIGILRDLTEQRELEERLRRAQRMEAIGRLASGVAHDFNNLLMGICGCADIAQQRISEGGDPLPYLDAITESARTGAADTRRLLAIGRGGRERIVTEALDQAVRRAVPVLRRFIGEDITLEVRYDAPGCSVQVPEGSIEQALINLAVNARDAMRHGGALTIETGCCDLLGGPTASLTVSDTGCGMDEETRAYAFEPFYTTKPPGKGTGLGLSTLYGLVNQAGGDVQLTSEVDRGTAVHILLPVATPDELEDPDTEPPRRVGADAGSQRRVLVVEDESLVRLAVRHYLESAGYRVEEAATAAAALDRAGDTGIDLVLTDVVLPGGGGRDLADALRAAHPTIAVVYMSAHPADQLRRAGRIEPDARSLQKPFTREDVIDVVSRALAVPEESD